MRYLCNKMIAQDDLSLLRSLKQGEASAFEELYSRYWKKIYAIAWHRLGDEEDADDLVQELFISIWERRVEIDLKGNFEQYLIGAVKFKVISLIRNQAVKEGVFNELKKRMTEIEEAEVERAIYPDLDKTLNDALLSLNENARMAFMLRSDNVSIKEIANQLGLREQTVRNYIADALVRIRAAVKEKYGKEPILYSCIVFAIVNHYLTQTLP